MDSNMIKEIVDFLSMWYIWEIIIIVLAILITLLVKIPIKRAAIKWQEEYGIDKSKITWINGIFPYIFVFIMVFVLFWYKSGWDMELKDPQFWKDVGSRTAILGSGAIGLYELIKKLKQAIIATKNVNKQAKVEKKQREAGIKVIPVHGDEVKKEKKAKVAPVKEEQPVQPVPVEKKIRH